MCKNFSVLLIITLLAAVPAWRKISADKAELQNILGNIYYKGDGVKQDYFEAIKCYKFAARYGEISLKI